MIETRQKTYKKPKSEGCHCSVPKPDGSCCNLVCFERPNYFCGHLLTDTDLSKEQQYVIEKHKLYNRTLHGSGVVCGLRLTCGDAECCGSIVIDEGYAIDDCGNDLVVCEPLRFDVVSLLKEKGWILGDPVYDPCLPEDEQEECEYTQCFYVTVCYDEESRDFTTPFVAGCRPTLTECEPTRIREGVRFDVLDQLPDEHEWLTDLIDRVKGCFSVFTDGPFARALSNDEKKRLLGTICKEPPDNIVTGQLDTYKELFFELRGLLFLYFQKHPDKYNCKLADEIRTTAFPDLEGTTGSLGPKLKEAFSNLLGLAFRHAISCALGELVPRCSGPKHAGCVVLGTVEVKGGCVTHVCNCPRKYVWSFANFFQVLLATGFGSKACEEKEEPTRSTAGNNPAGNNPAGAVNPSTTFPGRGENEEHKRHTCCREFDASCEDILPLLNIDPKFLQQAGAQIVRAFTNMGKSFRSIFDFTDARMFSPSMLLGMNQDKVDRAVSFLGIEQERIRYKDVAVAEAVAHPFEEFSRIGLARMGATDTTLVIERDKDVVVNAYAQPSWLHTGDSELEARVIKAEADAKAAKDLAEQLGQQLQDFMSSSAGTSGSEAQNKIKEILNSLPETPATETRSAKKRSSKRPQKPQAPEGEEGKNG